MDTYQEKTSRSKGFTLIELLVTIAIVAIITSIGIPGFNGIMRSNRLTSNINQLITSLNYARSEAVKRNRSIIVERIGNNWRRGWNVFIDDDADGTFVAANDTLLRTYDSIPGGYTLTGFATSVTFSASGISNGNGNFRLCENRDGNNTPEANTSRVVIVNALGRVSIGTDADGNGIPDDESGNEITSCI